MMLKIVVVFGNIRFLIYNFLDNRYVDIIIEINVWNPLVHDTFWLKLN